MTSLLRHNWCILERPCDFAIFDGRSPKFCKENDINGQIEGCYDVIMTS